MRIKLKTEITMPENVIKCNGMAEKLEIPFSANKSIFFRGYFVVPACVFAVVADTAGFETD